MMSGIDDLFRQISDSESRERVLEQRIHSEKASNESLKAELGSAHQQINQSKVREERLLERISALSAEKDHSIRVADSCRLQIASYREEVEAVKKQAMEEREQYRKKRDWFVEEMQKTNERLRGCFEEVRSAKSLFAATRSSGLSPDASTLPPSPNRAAHSDGTTAAHSPQSSTQEAPRGVVVTDISIDGDSESGEADRMQLVEMRSQLEAKKEELSRTLSDLQRLDDYTKRLEEAYATLQQHAAQLGEAVSAPCRFCGAGTGDSTDLQQIT